MGDTGLLSRRITQIRALILRFCRVNQLFQRILSQQYVIDRPASCMSLEISQDLIGNYIRQGQMIFQSTSSQHCNTERATQILCNNNFQTFVKTFSPIYYSP